MKIEQLTEIAETALNDGALIFNPEESDYEDIMSILKAAFLKRNAKSKTQKRIINRTLTAAESSGADKR